MSDIERSVSRSASPRRPRVVDEGMRDSRSRSRSRKSRERKEAHRPVKQDYSRSRSRSLSRGRKPYRGAKYANASHRGNSRSRSRSPYRGGRYSRSRSRSYSRSRYSRERERDRNIYRSHSRSPMSSRRRHIGNRDNPRPSHCLGIFGLSIYTTEQQIHRIFSEYGPVERVQVVIDAKEPRAQLNVIFAFELHFTLGKRLRSLLTALWDLHRENNCKRVAIMGYLNSDINILHPDDPRIDWKMKNRARDLERTLIETTGRSRGFCFVYFESIENAKVAKEQCSGMGIDGRRIRVDFSVTQRAHTPTPGIYMGKPTHLHDRAVDSREGPRRRDYRGSYRRSPSPYSSNRRRSRYDRSRSRSYSPRRY